MNIRWGHRPTCALGLMLAAGMPGSPNVQAADISGAALRPSMSAPVLTTFDWTGFYIGAHLGGFYGRDTATSPVGELLNPISMHSANVLAGGFGGYNFQFSQVVLGIEGDFSAILGGRKLSIAQPTIAPAIFASGSTDPKWLATLTGRFGLAANNWLFYGKAGVAWARANVTGNLEDASGTVLQSQTLSTTRSGWLVGAGIEYAWNRNWSSRLEYNYADFGTSRQTFTLAGFNSADIATKVHIVKIGLAYRFGAQ